MELSQHDFLEELLAPMRRESSISTTTTWSNSSVTFSNHGGANSCDQPFFPTTHWGFDSFEENPILAISPISSSSNPSPFLGFSTLLNDHDTNHSCPFSTTHDRSDYPNFVVDHIDNDEVVVNTIIPSSHQEDHYPQNSLVVVEDDHQEFGFKGTNDIIGDANCCKVEMIMLDQQSQLPQQGCSEFGVVNPSFNIGVCDDKKGIRSKKLEGQPSKNLMAERRRRKRLNDRLSMLRSIVPKISKMDRTSILGDTIDYMKELLERINKLQEGIEEGRDEQVNLLGISKDVKSNDVMVRNSPKFDVDRRGMDTRIDICCAAKPGLLLSTMKTIEALGLEIQQCVISCFNDFSLQASCSEGPQQRTLISCEDIKQAIFRNAGYGGRCL